MEKNKKVLCLLLICQVVAGQIPAGMVLVPSGELSVKKSEKVKIKAFYMDTCEVTIAQFEQFINATGYKTDAGKKGFSICYGGDSIAGATWRCGPAGKLRLGIYDLFGNVYEFVSPSFIRNSEELVKVKGGCFVDADKKNIERFLIYYKHMTTHMAGFRCVKDLQ